MIDHLSPSSATVKIRISRAYKTSCRHPWLCEGCENGWQIVFPKSGHLEDTLAAADADDEAA